MWKNGLAYTCMSYPQGILQKILQSKWKISYMEEQLIYFNFHVYHLSEKFMSYNFISIKQRKFEKDFSILLAYQELAQSTQYCVRLLCLASQHIMLVLSMPPYNLCTGTQQICNNVKQSSTSLCSTLSTIADCFSILCLFRAYSNIYQ